MKLFSNGLYKAIMQRIRPEEKQEPTEQRAENWKLIEERGVRLIGQPEPEQTADEQKPKRPAYKKLIKWLVAILLVNSLLLNMLAFVFPIVRHYGRSMSPTLTEKQIILLHKTDTVEQGDIVAFYYNNDVMIRRVIAVAGDSVDIDIFGTVYVNGTPLTETYVPQPTRGQTDLIYPYTVPTNSYFVMGDQREISMDSRLQEIGCVPADRMIGKAFFSVYPFHSLK